MQTKRSAGINLRWICSAVREGRGMQPGLYLEVIYLFEIEPDGLKAAHTCTSSKKGFISGSKNSRTH